MKKFKNSKVTDIFWTPFNNGCYLVRYSSKKKSHWKGFPNDPSMKIADCSSLYLYIPFGTPHSILLKEAYNILNNL